MGIVIGVRFLFAKSLIYMVLTEENIFLTALSKDSMFSSAPASSLYWKRCMVALQIPRTQASTASINRSGYETIDITVLRCGVIGVNKIGYVMT